MCHFSFDAAFNLRGKLNYQINAVEEKYNICLQNTVKNGNARVKNKPLVIVR